MLTVSFDSVSKYVETARTLGAADAAAGRLLSFRPDAVSNRVAYKLGDGRAGMFGARTEAGVTWSRGLKRLLAHVYEVAYDAVDPRYCELKDLIWRKKAAIEFEDGYVDIDAFLNIGENSWRVPEYRMAWLTLYAERSGNAVMSFKNDAEMYNWLVTDSGARAVGSSWAALKATSYSVRNAVFAKEVADTKARWEATLKAAVEAGKLPENWFVFARHESYVSIIEIDENGCEISVWLGCYSSDYWRENRELVDGFMNRVVGPLS